MYSAQKANFEAHQRLQQEQGAIQQKAFAEQQRLAAEEQQRRDEEEYARMEEANRSPHDNVFGGKQD